MKNSNIEKTQPYRIYIQLNTLSDIEEFTNICSGVAEDVIMHGKDEYGSDWSLSAKSLFCSLVMNARLQKNREHTAHDVNWNTIYVECEKDIYPLLYKFTI